MKKLMILVLVFGLASVTNAALVLSVDGNTDVTEITIAPSDEITIDVYSPLAGVDQFWVNVKGPASLAGTGTVYAAAPSTMVADNGTYGPSWIHGYMTTPVTTAAVGVWWDEVLHCDGEGDVIVDLYDSTGMTIIDSILIHQIPEPITIALLGLGGLFLRRRK